MDIQTGFGCEFMIAFSDVTHVYDRTYGHTISMKLNLKDFFSNYSVFCGSMIIVVVERFDEVKMFIAIS